MDMEWRKPFALVMNKNQIPEHQQYQLRYTISESVVTPPISVSDYTFKRIDSDLLIDIDENNVKGVEDALKKDNIDVNNLYVIPAWELPEAGKPMFQTFLHRALWCRSENVFKFLLDKGANPRIKGHCDETVIDNVFDKYNNEKNFLKFGIMLVDAGMTADEIKKASKHMKGKNKVIANKLIHRANVKAKNKSVSIKQKHTVNKSEHIR